MSADDFEQLAAKFIAVVVQKTPKKLVSIIFASPLSARSPDLCMLWHHGYRNKHSFKILIDQLGTIAVNSFKGFLQLIFNIKPVGYALYGKIDDTLLVSPAALGQITDDDQYKTAYVSTKKDNAVFVFGSANNCGKKVEKVAGLKFKDKLLRTCLLINGGIHAFFLVKGSVFEKMLLLLEWFSWVVSLQWLYDYYLERSLSEVVEKYRIKKIGCIHEMHSYARIVWRVASEYGAKGFAVQHAAVTSGKRWYFCYSEEIQRGLKLPSIMYVYNKGVIELLKPHFDITQFKLGCSSRYVHWKTVRENNNRGKYYLFVGALAGFDNKILFELLKRLADIQKSPLPIKVRLHQCAITTKAFRSWLETSENNGVLEISRNTALNDDLNSAITIIGMSTTVLEEALLLGRPVIQITHPDYLKFIDLEGIQGAITIDYDKLSAQDLINMPNAEVNSEALKEKLGLSEEEVTYNRLFS